MLDQLWREFASCQQVCSSARLAAFGLMFCKRQEVLAASILTPTPQTPGKFLGSVQSISCRLVRPCWAASPRGHDPVKELYEVHLARQLRVVLLPERNAMDLSFRIG